MKKTYAEKKKKNPKYKYKDAMKDAKKTYKKGGSIAPAKKRPAPPKKYKK